MIAATGVGGLETMEHNEATFIERGASRVSPFFVTMMMPNATAGTIAINFGWTGPNLCIATACAVGRERDRRRRTHVARRQRRGGRRGRHRSRCHAAHDLRVRAHGRVEQPQRRSVARVASVRRVDRDGFVMAEGAAFVILESLERALARGARIYGEMRGYGRNDDAHHITAPSPGGEGAAACMQLALDDACLSADADRAHQRARHVHTVERRGRSRGDPQGVRRRRRAPVTSTKGVTGHMIGGAGAAEACISLLSLGNGIAPPTANLEQIGDDIGLDIVSGEVREIGATPVLSNSFGFGGHNAALILAPVE